MSDATAAGADGKEASREAASSGPARHAIYWAPDPAHPLWHAGCDWLGRDAAAPADGRTPPPRAHVAAPARYGFHATLKAPFRLMPGASAHDLAGAAAALAARHADFEMPALEVAWLDDFLALRPAQPLLPQHPLRQLADACVAELDAWRAPMAPTEQARHAATVEGDAARQALLARWGYPHVLEAWRFHMTLGDRFADRQSAAARRFEAEARECFAPSLAQSLRAAALCIFEEPGPGQLFRLIHRLPLGGGDTR
jgi:hypothetical protein